MKSVLLEMCGSADVLQIVQSIQSSDWPSQPLTEDLHLQKFSALDVAHKDLSFESHSRLDLSLQQEVGDKHSEIIFVFVLIVLLSKSVLICGKRNKLRCRKTHFNL